GRQPATPDGLPLVGKIPGKRNAYCITGLRAGLGEGGGHGWLLAQMIAHGEACYDTWCLDPRRFTRYANVEYTGLKAIEDYQNEFRFHMPHEHRPAGRPMKTTPLTDTLAALGAEFGTVNGWERALYYKPDETFAEHHSFRFNETFDVVAAEVANVQNNVGIMEVSGFNRFAITGNGIHDWLNGLSCSRIPRKAGKVGLAYFLNAKGDIKAEATLANIADGTVWYGSAAASEFHDMDWLQEHLPADSDIGIENLTNTHTILVVAGPKSRELLSRAAPRTDWSPEAFPWLSCRKVFIGNAEALAMSVSFSGELAWELHIPNAQLKLTFDTLWLAGQPLGLKMFGSHATESMRLEKGYRHWKADLITEFNPAESDLMRFVDMKKGFLGKPALVAGDNQPRARFVALSLHSREAPAHPGDSILANGKVVGTVTSADWGHRLGKNIAMGFIAPEHAEGVDELIVETAIGAIPAERDMLGPYDPDASLVKS
ncbi:MAG: glycine cleavage T C-terminal barrel domain-containing protein, partial [Pseudomonadota bacterium]